MNKNLVTFEGGRIILNVNAIAMVFPHDEDNNLTCINIISGNRTFYIRENYESVKKKLDNWVAKEGE
jgi:hypothetical protein